VLDSTPALTECDVVLLPYRHGEANATAAAIREDLPGSEP
jgi:hypothetical protein